MNATRNERPFATGTLAWVGPILADRSLDATETLLLIGLADHVDSKDECFVGIDTLASYARVSYATAKRRLKDLVDKGRIERSRRRRDDGNLSTYTWKLIRPGLTMSHGAEQGLDLSHDQGSPGSAMTRAHPDEPAEVPSGEPPSDEQPSPSPDGDKERGFDRFWEVYPARNGRKVGKAKSLTKWRALSLDSKRVAYRAAINYARAVQSGATIPKDPERFLANRYFEDWAEGLMEKLEHRTILPMTPAMEANARRARGEACPECEDTGFVLDPSGNAVACTLHGLMEVRQVGLQDGRGPGLQAVE